MDWSSHAARLAGDTTSPRSRWRDVVECVPRHVFVPRWWQRGVPLPGPYGTAEWTGISGPADPAAWMSAAYSDRTLVTRVGPDHADDADPGQTVTGAPTSSATLPSLLVQMFRHAEIEDQSHVLDVGTGSGYGAALLAARLGDEKVTTVDLDSYLVAAAADRLDRAGFRPKTLMADATCSLPGTYDRIVATMSVRPIPVSWLDALQPGGRLVTTIAGTGLILVADTAPDGGAEGRIVWDRAGFMAARPAGSAYPDYPRRVAAIMDAYVSEGDLRVSRYPMVCVPEAWELWSMLGVESPGIEYDYREENGVRTAVMVHPDGSWARATAAAQGGPVHVWQGGPRRLWDLVDELRERWLRDGSLPVYGARARVEPDGRIVLRRGSWTATLD